MKHFLYICIKCNKLGEPGPQTMGEKLFEKVSLALKESPLQEAYCLKPVSCMNGCSHACTVGFAAESKVSYVFGDMDPSHPPTDILKGAALYLEKEDGIMKKNERPDALKESVLARLPIFPKE